MLTDNDHIEIQETVDRELKKNKEIDKDRENSLSKENITETVDREIIKTGAIKKAETIDRVEITKNIRKNIEKRDQDLMRDIVTIDILIFINASFVYSII